MKKLSHIIFWVVVAGMAMLALYTFYHANKPGQQLQQPTTGSEKTSVTPQATKPGENTEASPQPTPAKQMAPDFTLKNLDGNEVKLSDYKGKVVILNFWTTWCKYCIEELPDFNEAGKEFAKSDDAVILAINVQENPKDVREFVSKNKLGLQVLLDTEGKIAGLYNVSGYPTTFVIERDGTIYGYAGGAIDKKTLMDAVDKIK